MSGTRELFSNNLWILGFDPIKWHKNHLVQFPSDLDLLGKGNAKAMDVILYFLFTCLDPKAAQEQFCLVWPAHDPKQTREFRSTCFKWLEQLKKANAFPPAVPIRRSYLDECKGERFEQLMLVFSNYVVSVAASRLNPRILEVGVALDHTLPTSEATKRMLQVHILRLTHKFKKEVARRGEIQASWKEISLRMKEEMEQLEAQKSRLRQQQGQEVQSFQIFESIDENALEEGASFYREGMSKVLGFIESQKIQRTVLGEVIGQQANKQVLDGREIAPRISQEFVSVWEKDLMKNQVNPFQGNKVDVVSLVKIWKLSLLQLSHTLNVSPPGRPSPQPLINAPKLSTMPEFGQLTSEARLDIENQAGYLQNLKGLKSNLKDRLQQLQASIKALQAKDDAGLRPTPGAEAPLPYGEGLGFTNPHPTLDFRIHSVPQDAHWLNFTSSFNELSLSHSESWFLDSLDPARQAALQAKELEKRKAEVVERPQQPEPEAAPTLSEEKEEKSQARPKKAVSFGTGAPKAPVATSKPAIVQRQSEALSHLASKIAAQMAREDQGSAREMLEDDALANPLTAMGLGAFKTKKELMRTPIRNPRTRDQDEETDSFVEDKANPTSSPTDFRALPSPMDVSSPFIIRRQSDSTDHSLSLEIPFTPLDATTSFPTPDTSTRGFADLLGPSSPLLSHRLQDESLIMMDQSQGQIGGSTPHSIAAVEDPAESSFQIPDGKTDPPVQDLPHAEVTTSPSLLLLKDGPQPHDMSGSPMSDDDGDSPAHTIVKRLDFSNSSSEGAKTPRRPLGREATPRKRKEDSTWLNGEDDLFDIRPTFELEDDESGAI